MPLEDTLKKKGLGGRDAEWCGTFEKKRHAADDVSKKDVSIVEGYIMLQKIMGA